MAIKVITKAIIINGYIYFYKKERIQLKTKLTPLEKAVPVCVKRVTTPGWSLFALATLKVLHIV